MGWASLAQKGIDQEPVVAVYMVLKPTVRLRISKLPITVFSCTDDHLALDRH
jgi:hypothetical protein